MGLPRTRRRPLQDTYYGRGETHFFGGITPSEANIRCHQITDDEYATGFLDVHGPKAGPLYKGNPYKWDLGGLFYSRTYNYHHDNVVLNLVAWGGGYFGPTLAAVSNADSREPAHQQGVWNEPYPTETTLLWGLGGTAISRCSPVNPHANTANALIELARDGLPDIAGATLRRQGLKPSSLGSEYLNLEFGLKPIINDIKSIRDASVNAERILQQYKRDSGKLVRRQYRFPELVETTISDAHAPYPWPGLNGWWYQKGGATTKTVTTTKSYRFSGAFSYMNAGDLDGRIAYLQGIIQQTNHLLGIALTPSVVWDSLPWSWFIDWFTNIGDVISNISQIMTDGLVLHWGYLSEWINVTTVYDHKGTVFSDGTSGDQTQTFTFTSKRRVRSSPFGFGFDMTTLSGRQLAIMASLGLTKGGRYKAM